ncbi:MAG: DUF1501 domain-containing protein [Pyrinomonadaceae bacterium]|nr:DUF1501 domain-containing protein [Pyrinomonadaceae bacterium]
MDRRFFLKSSGVALASFGYMNFAPDALHQFAANAATLSTDGKRKTLIVIFQRGAVDGLNVVVPYGDSDYYNLRRSIAVQKPKQNDGAIDLDGFFGLNPAMKSFQKLWESKQLAVINAVGSPSHTRSHFDAQDYMEAGTPGIKSTRDGWLNRVLQTQAEKESSPFRAVSLTAQTPRSLMGRAESIALTNISDFNIKAGNTSNNVQGGFEAIYQQTTGGDSLGNTGKETFEAIQTLKNANPANIKTENGAIYPNTQFGNSLRQIAQLVKANIGLEVAFTDTPNMRWDTHANEGGARGQLANFLREFSTSIAALTTDLGKRMDDVIILTMSEFGRTARENGTGGTDHGHANSMFVIGNSVKGGKVYTDWRGLANDKLHEGRDLEVTTDFRNVLSEISSKHLGNKNLEQIFPNFSLSKDKFSGFLG